MIQLLSITYPATVVVVFIVFFARLWLTRRRRKTTNVCMVIHSQDAEILLEAFMLKKISLAASYLIVSLTGVSVTGATAVLDGTLSVVSSDPGVLTVTPQEGGLFRVDLIGVGQAQLIVSGDADLGDGVRTISQEFGFEIYDPFTEADHFDLAIVEWQLRDAAELSDPSADSQAAGASETA